MQGFIKLYRKMINNDLWFAERFTKAQAWIDLLLCATFKKRSVFIRTVEVVLEPGELCYSQKTLAKRWKWNDKTVRNYLKYLERQVMVRCKITPVTTLITIINWENYNFYTPQDTLQDGEQFTLLDILQDNAQTPNRIRTNNNDKNYNKNNIIENEKEISTNVNNSEKQSEKAVTNKREKSMVNPGFEALSRGDRVKGL